MNSNIFAPNCARGGPYKHNSVLDENVRSQRVLCTTVVKTLLTVDRENTSAKNTVFLDPSDARWLVYKYSALIVLSNICIF